MGNLSVSQLNKKFLTTAFFVRGTFTGLFQLVMLLSGSKGLSSSVTRVQKQQTWKSVII